MSDHPARRPMRVASAAMICSAMLVGAGCGTIRMTDTPRAATEQLLLTESWDMAIGAVDFSPLVGPPVYLETSHLSGPDQGWMIYRIRESMARQGVHLVDDRDEAIAIVEAGAAVYATDSNTSLIGIPSNGLVGAMAGAGGMVLPEVALAKKSEQYGVTRLALFARDVPSGRIVWESGTIDADSYLQNASVLGIPARSGSISHPTDRRRNHWFRQVFGWARRGEGPRDQEPGPVLLGPTGLPPILPPG